MPEPLVVDEPSLLVGPVTDLALIDPRSREDVVRYEWAVAGRPEMGGSRPLGADWYRLSPPGWFAGEGWSLTPETGGVARATGRGAALALDLAGVLAGGGASLASPASARDQMAALRIVSSATSFAAVLDGMLEPPAQHSAIALPLKPLDELYVEPARQYLMARGASIRTNAQARVVFNGEAVSHVAVRDEALRAGTVICAAPWYAWPDILTPGPFSLTPVTAAAAKTPASPIVTVNLWFDRVVLDVPFIGLPGRVNQWVFEKRIAFGERASHLSSVSSGAEPVVAWTNQQLIDQAVAESVGHFHAQVERARNLLLGMLGHDMRSPLSTILATASIDIESV